MWGKTCHSISRYPMDKFTTFFFLVLLLASCSGRDKQLGAAITERDSLPVMDTRGVTTLISDSGLIRYRIKTEEWKVFDRKTPPYWAFEKGVYLEKFDTLFQVEASIKAEPRKAPIQGVHPSPNTIPKRKVEIIPISVFASIPPVPLKILRRITPKKFRPNKMTINPQTRLTPVWYLLSSPPRVPAKAPSTAKVIVKPNTKARAFQKGDRLFSFLPPAKYAAYTGSIGRRQGEIKVIRPSKNVIR